MEKVTSIMLYKHRNHIFHAVPELIRQGNALLRNAGHGLPLGPCLIFRSPFRLLLSRAVCLSFSCGQCGQCFWRASGSRFGPALPLWLMILMRQFVKIKTIIHSCCGAQSVFQLLCLTSSKEQS